MPILARRKGLYRVHGGFAYACHWFALVVSWRPGAAEWSWKPTRDFSGYRTMRLGRLSVLHIGSFRNG